MQLSYMEFATKEEKVEIEKKIDMLRYDIKYLSELEKYKTECRRYEKELKEWIQSLEDAKSTCNDLEVKYWYSKIIRQFKVFIREGYM